MNKPFPPVITQVEMTAAEVEIAHKIGKRLGYEQLAYTSCSSLWGVFCLPKNSATWKGNKRALQSGCIIKTNEFGFLFVADLEDMHMEDLIPQETP